MVECPTCGQECATENGMKNHHAQIHGESLAKMVIAECNWCGETEEIYESQHEQFGNWYCSRDCYDEKQSETRKGKSLEELIGEEAAEYCKNKLSEAMLKADYSGENNPNYGNTYDVSDETRKKISEALKGREASKATWMYDDELEHFTRSEWEREFGRELKKRGIQYEYEGVEVDMGDGHVYRPDFYIPELECIVEVKGRIWNDDTYDKAENCMDQYPDYDYVVLGSKLPCDVHHEWKDREDFFKT